MHATQRFASKGFNILGIDNINTYYDPLLKLDRLNQLRRHKNFELIVGDIESQDLIEKVFNRFKPDIVIHLAAQAGVRYSLEDPNRYIQSNIVGFQNILDAAKRWKVGHFIYASSSSVYGNQSKIPFKESDPVDHPVSLYAATKRANELVAHTYSHLYQLQTTGLRFFTVYGPWGRPDMAPHLFASAILAGRAIKVFNHGNLSRDFTYIDDVVECLERIISTNSPSRQISDKSQQTTSSESGTPFRILNIGNHTPVKLLDFIRELESTLGKSATLEMQPMQPGDVLSTFACTDELYRLTNFRPSTPLPDGLKAFSSWHKTYYGN